MGWNASNAFVVLIVSGSTGFTGVFVYSPTPGLGHLAASITAAAGTDPYGNSYQAGITVYDDTSPFLSAWVQMLSRGLTWQTVGGGVPGVIESVGAAELFIGGPGNVADTVATVATLTLLAKSVSSSGGPAVLIAAGNASQQTTGLVEIQGRTEIINPGTSGVTLLKVTQTQPNPGNVPVQILGQGAGDRALGVIVAGDSSNRWRVATDGTMLWGNGTTTDATLYRAAAAQLAADNIAANVAGAAETWHLMSARGYSNGWLDGTDAAAQYRLDAAPSKSVTLAGSLTVPAGAVAGQTIVNLPAAYRPANTQALQYRNKTNNSVGSLGYGSAGTVSFQPPAGSFAAGDILDFAGRIYLDL